MTKKITCFALALIMLCSIFAFSANALTLGAGEYGIIVKSDATVGQAADTTVTVSLYYQYPAGTAADYRMAVSSTVLAFNKAKYQYVSTNWILTNSEGVQFMKANSANDITDKVTPKFTTDDSNHGWNEVRMFQQAYDTNAQSEIKANTGYPITLDANNQMKYCEITFKVLATLTADDVIGIPRCTVDTMKNTNFKYYASGVKSIDPSKVITTEGIAAPQSAVEIKKVAVQGQYVDETKTAWNVGIKGEFSTFTADDFNFVEKISQKVTEVGVKVTAGDDTTAYTTGTVYLVGSKYQFRAVIKNIPVDSTDEVTVEFYATKSGSPVSGEKFTLKFADEYTAFAGRWADAQ